MNRDFGKKDIGSSSSSSEEKHNQLLCCTCIFTWFISVLRKRFRLLHVYVSRVDNNGQWFSKVISQTFTKRVSSILWCFVNQRLTLIISWTEYKYGYKYLEYAVHFSITSNPIPSVLDLASAAAAAFMMYSLLHMKSH